MKWFCRDSPTIGEKWVLASDPDDPFPSKRFRPVEVIGIKDGWVRYKLSDDGFNDERMPIKTFVKIYRKIKAPPFEMLSLGEWKVFE